MKVNQLGYVKVNQLGYVAPHNLIEEFQEIEFGKLSYSVLLMCKIPIYGIRAITKSVDS